MTFDVAHTTQRMNGVIQLHVKRFPDISKMNNEAIIYPLIVAMYYHMYFFSSRASLICFHCSIASSIAILFRIMA